MQKVQAGSTEPTRISIACISCKTRKRRCDGGTPKCANCSARNLDCNYAAIRRTRGPAKKNTGRDAVEVRSDIRQHLPPSSLLTDDGVPCPDSREDNMISTVGPTNLTDESLQEVVVVSKSISEQSTTTTTTTLESSQTQITIKNHLPIFPEFILPGAFEENLKIYKTAIAEGIAARNYTPLLPLHISRRLIQNSFDEIMAENRLMSLTHFITHLEDHFAAGSHDPGDYPSRWALVNAVTALAIRSKTASGSQTIVDITNGIYENATKILPQLILQDPHLLSIQALLAMASFAREVGNVSAFVMLASSASRQLELLTVSWPSMDRVIVSEEMEQYELACKAANVFETCIRSFLNADAAMCEGLTQFVDPHGR